MRILVAIASYGTRNDRYLAEVIRRYQAMPYVVDIVVLSNILKQVPAGVHVTVGLPTKDPWSLPFAHKNLFAERANDYDLFVYSEDDTPLSARNIEAFLRVTEILPNNLISGFLRSEAGTDGKQYFCDVLGPFHWDPNSVQRKGDCTFAFFTNEHSACYILTKEQLRKAIASGGFLVEPHEENYDLLCTAATDPYTQCGFRKVICISHIQDFIVPHLPNKYIGTFGVSADELNQQINVLLRLDGDACAQQQLFQTTTRLKRQRYSKIYYEPAREDVAQCIPPEAKSVLSIGCGSGKMEAWLAEKSFQVTAIPLDQVISAGLESKGVDVVGGSFETSRTKLEGLKYDCMLFSNVLHLVSDPAAVLCSFSEVLSDAGIAISIVPNVSRVSLSRKKNRGNLSMQDAADFEKTGVHLTSPRILKEWYQQSGMKVERVVEHLSPRRRKAGQLTFGITDSWLASEFLAVGRKL